MRKKLIITGVVLTTLLVIYFIIVNILVSATLVPSFMEKLDSFERIYDQCMAEQVYTEDIVTNQQEAFSETRRWYEESDHKKIVMISKDNYRLVAEEFTPQEESHKWAFLLHGYTGWKEETYPYACWYSSQGYHIFAPDQRCQGESEGDFIGMGWTDHYDCLDWLSYIIEQDPEAEIVIHGQSMGASTALILSGSPDLPENVKAIISDCAYTDAYSMFGNKAKEWFHLPAFPLVDSACLVLRLRGGYDLKKASPIDAVKKSTTPTLFIHGTEDALIPVDMAYQLYDAAACPKELLIMDGAGHAQSQDKDPELYYGKITAFLAAFSVGTEE